MAIILMVQSIGKSKHRSYNISLKFRLNRASSSGLMVQNLIWWREMAVGKVIFRILLLTLFIIIICYLFIHHSLINITLGYFWRAHFSRRGIWKQESPFIIQFEPWGSCAYWFIDQSLLANFMTDNILQGSNDLSILII